MAVKTYYDLRLTASTPAENRAAGLDHLFHGNGRLHYVCDTFAEMPASGVVGEGDYATVIENGLEYCMKSGVWTAEPRPAVPVTKGGTGLAGVGAPLQVLRTNASGTALEFATLDGGGDMLAANNLSDLASPAAARTNLGLGTAATTNATAYATAAQGALAATALQSFTESDPVASAALATHASLSTTAHGGIVASTDPRLTDARTPLAHNQAWSTITSTPTTLAGYGISDAAPAAHTHTFASLTSKPTTLAGYGITDAPTGSGTSTGTNTGDNAANSTYANDYRAANFVAGTHYLAPNGSAAALTSFPTLNQSTTGSAATLTTPRTINGVSFNGSANITITADAGTLTGTLLPATIGTGSALQVVRRNAANTALEFATLAGGGDMLGANNLSDLANAATARNNLGLGNVSNTADTDKPVSTAQQTALNLKADTTSLNHGHYRLVAERAGSHIAARVAGTYAIPTGGNPLAISGTGTLYPIGIIQIAAADFPTVNGLAAKLRIRAQLCTNDVAPTGNYTIGLYPVTRPATSGGAGVCIFTLGTVVSGSTGATFTAPAADAALTAVSADFALPADGLYVLGVVTTGTVATSSLVHLSAQLQSHNA